MQSRVVFILDRSGSMQSILSDTIGGFAAYIQILQESGDDVDITLVQFDSQSIDTVYENMPVSEVGELVLQPRGSTPLIEAVTKTLKRAKKHNCYDKTIVVILTDGQENCSRSKYTNKRLKKMVKRREEDGWQFMYIGAGIDAYTQSAAIGIGRGQTISYDSTSPVASAAMFSSAGGQSVGGMRGQTISFSDEEKKQAGDKFAKK